MHFDIDSSPVYLVAATFFTIAFIRSLATYGLGRYGTVLATRYSAAQPTAPGFFGRLALRVAAIGRAGGTKAVERVGLVAVPLSFLAPGTKTVVNAAAGLLTLPLWKYVPALVLGCCVHAVIYTFVGWAAWQAIIAAAAASPWAAVALVAVVAGIVTTVVISRRRKVAQTPEV